jgi:Protein of unknown function (DUF2723)
MNSFKKLNNIVGWLVFFVAMSVYYFSVERTGSLWDCGEFIAGCYKLQVVHPPGAPLFLMVGKMATVIGQLFSKNPSVIAFSVNILSGISGALTALFVCWTTIILGKIALVGREEEPNQSQFIALAGSGIVAGLCTAFATSIWFSAVEGEVYSMSTMFTAMTLWCMMKWYNQPDTPEADRWMMAAVYAAGLSTGVHLLSLLTFPALALFYYFKKNEKPTWLGMIVAGIVGVMSIWAVQSIIITGIPSLWSEFEYVCVNYVGLPFTYPSLILTLAAMGGLFYTGFQLAKGKYDSKILIPFTALLGLLTISAFGWGIGGIFKGLVFTGLATYFILQRAQKGSSNALQNVFMGMALSALGFSTIGTVMIRAVANPPINMNNPSDAMRVIPYINREQYGERPLLYGTQFNARPVDQTSEDRFGRVGDKYDVVDKKTDYVFNNEDKVLFPRMGHMEGDRTTYYKLWMDIPSGQEIPTDRPDGADNMSFFLRYQVGWMYWRYFMWNFAGRQNAEQGFTPTDKSKGNWVSGIPFLDKYRLFDDSAAPNSIKHDPAYNKYYLLPLLFGLFGLVWHYGRRRYDMLGLMALFIITGIGIIVYTNEPPNEPRERDYVIVGSIFTFSIWIGMGVLAFFDLFKDFKLSESLAAPLATALVVTAPIIMGYQNFDDHSRAKQSGARDYAVNFLESCDKNAVIFTYGDNDTYPLWYAQEVESVRRDVRVVNLSLIAVDWYINQQRRKINESPAIKMSLPEASYRGMKRNQLPIRDGAEEMSIQDLMKFLGEEHPVPAGGGMTFESYAPTRKIYIPVNRDKAIAAGIANPQDSIVDKIHIELKGSYLIKDDLAVLDIIANNAMERPVYFAVTCRPEKLQGMDDYMQLEGLATKIVPVKSPSEKAFGLIGNGRVAGDKILDRVTNKFRWGNFDKEQMFVNRSYQPSIQTTQFAMLRTALDFARKGEKEKAVKMLDKQFEVFPNFNFPYSAQTMYFIDAYVQAGAYEQSKKHIQILADNLYNNLMFYNTLDATNKSGSFQQDFMSDLQTKEQLLRIVEQSGDAAYKADLEKKFAAFKIDAMMPR